MQHRNGQPGPARQPANGRPPSGLSLQLDQDALAPLVREIVREVLQQLEEARTAVPEGRLAWSEEEAARLPGLEPHVLRDERRRGRIGASSIVGRRIRYTRRTWLSTWQGGG